METQTHATSQIISAPHNSLTSKRRYKYPRTPDDKVLRASAVGANFGGQAVVVTEKLDGENSTLYVDGLHARSLDSGNQQHESRDWLKGCHPGFAHTIPLGWRVCGENLYARHSIHYHHLTALFQVYSIWNAYNECLAWDDTLEWCELLGLASVPVWYRGVWPGKVALDQIYQKQVAEQNDAIEGYVVRLASAFTYEDFNQAVAKWVRPDHVQPQAAHWLHAQLVPNKVARQSQLDLEA